MQMNINLTPQLEDMVRKKVASGLYTSASEVVREALRLMEEQDRVRAAKFEQMKSDIHDGIHSGIASPWNAEEVRKEGRKRQESRHKSGRSEG
jgi:antitoxin ParD1/3/4